MSKGLKALKDLKENVCYFAIEGYAYPRLDIIEKELKDSEYNLKLAETLGEENHKLLLEQMNNYKKLKALEIIKNKNVFVWGFIHRQEEINDFEPTYDYYKTHYGYFHSGYKFELLTKEEYDLLKEVLL